MEKIRKVDISEILGMDFKIERYQCFNPNLELMYNNYLKYRNIELQYKNKNLMEYINEQRNSMLNFKTNEEYYKEKEKEEKKRHFKENAVKVIVSLAITGSLIANQNIITHEIKNIYNTNMFYKYFGTDKDKDQVVELDTEILNYVDDYYKPTEDRFYRNSNPFYNLYDETRIIDNISFMAAFDILGIDIIEIDGIKYSKTGYITEINYKDLDYNINESIKTSRTFNNDDDVLNFLKEMVKNKSYKVNSCTTYKVDIFDNIPSIYKSKEDGHIELKKPNILLTKLLKKII